MTARTGALSASIGLKHTFYRGNITSGVSVYYSNGGTPETWTLETQKVELSITDTVSKRINTAVIKIVDPLNVKVAVYTPYLRMKLVDSKTNRTIFVGIIEVSEPKYESGMQFLYITLVDYLKHLAMNKVSSTFLNKKRSEIIAELVTNYSYNSEITTTNIEASGDASTVPWRDYLSSNKTPLDIIEELAIEDPWTASTWLEVDNYDPITFTDVTALANQRSGYTTFKILTHTKNVVEADGGYVIIGQNNPFLGITFDLATPYTYSQIAWEYWNGTTWSTLPTTMSDPYYFAADGSMRWDLPTDWTPKVIAAVNANSYYYIKISTTDVSASTTNCTVVNSITCIVGYGYDYFIDYNKNFYYFRKGARPIYTDVGSGKYLTIALRVAETSLIKNMLSNFNFSDQPTEIYTKAVVRGVCKDGREVVKSYENTVLRDLYKINKIKDESVYNAQDMTFTELETYTLNRATAIITQQFSNQIQRGEVSIVEYPIYGASCKVVRAGEMIKIINSISGVSYFYTVQEISYKEPSCITTLKVLRNVYGKGFGAQSNFTILQSLAQGDYVTPNASKIRDNLMGRMPYSTATANPAYDSANPLPIGFMYVNVSGTPVVKVITSNTGSYTWRTISTT